MKKDIAFLILLLVFFSANAQQKTVPVFISGTDGYKNYRIPAIISLPNKDLLAFCEGRVNNGNDYGNIDIVMKRSTDKGKTWGTLQRIADYGETQLSNPAPVVDRTDPAYPQGRIFIFYNTGNNHESEILKGKGIKYCFYKTSIDGGFSWSEPVDITEQVHRPKQPSADAKYNFTEDWRYYANTPGHAMQFETGKYKGRIFIAANHSAGNPQKAAGHYVAHGYYSDDHGKTFKLGNSIDLPGSNESSAAELSDGRLMMNSRNQRGDVRERIVSISKDGGQTWDKTYFDPNLPDPVCQGSILTVGKRKSSNILAFCNSADTEIRDNLSLRISKDDGETWMKTIVLDYTGKNENTAYSDIVKIASKKIGVLYEKEAYSKIVFRAVKW